MHKPNEGRGKLWKAATYQWLYNRPIEAPLVGPDQLKPEQISEMKKQIEAMKNKAWNSLIANGLDGLLMPTTTMLPTEPPRLNERTFQEQMEVAHYWTRKELEEFLGQLTYKPNWWWAVRENETTGYGLEGFFVTPHWKAVDVDGHYQGLIEITGAPIFLPQHMNGGQVLTMLRKCIIDCELHEVDEHIKFRGVKIYDPHRSTYQVNKEKFNG